MASGELSEGRQKQSLLVAVKGKARHPQPVIPSMNGGDWMDVTTDIQQRCLDVVVRGFRLMAEPEPAEPETALLGKPLEHAAAIVIASDQQHLATAEFRQGGEGVPQGRGEPCTAVNQITQHEQTLRRQITAETEQWIQCAPVLITG